MGSGASKKARKKNLKEEKKISKKIESETEDIKIKQESKKRKIIFFDSNSNVQENADESLISYKNKDDEQNLEIADFGNKDREQNFDYEKEKNIIDEKDTNIFIAINVPYSQYRNSILFNLYFGPNKILEPILQRKINNYMVLFYHMPIKEEDTIQNNEIEGKQKLFLEVDSFLSYSTTIKFLYYHVNFLYDMTWEQSGNNRNGAEMPKIDFKISYLFYFLLNYLKICEVSNVLIGDILENFYLYLNKSKKINFEDLLYLLVESYKIKNEDLINKIYEMFEGKKIIYSRNIDTVNLFSNEDLEKYFFKEEIKKEKEAEKKDEGKDKKEEDKKEENKNEEEKKDEEKQEKEKKEEEKKEEEKKEEEKKEEEKKEEEKKEEEKKNNR